MHAAALIKMRAWISNSHIFPTTSTHACKSELAKAAALNEVVVAVLTRNHNNVDTRCWCTCWLAQMIWCIGGTQGDAHSIASSVLAVAVVTVRLHMRCAMM